ncbi:hypothetical protein ACFYXL_05865 [Streptomyces tsukubensis]|uniref:hypothetical protein n=1 Tax=Streptomyces tsukubensis TaxID=83656 RepID=UPI003674A704
MPFISAHPARLSAAVAAALALVAHYVPSLPTELVVALVAAILGTGEWAQVTEDRKTVRAGEGGA